MNKKAILEKIAKLHPGYKVDSSFIFCVNGHAVTGCAIDFTPACIYLWELLIPLYDPFPFMHLTMSNRIGFLEKFDKNLGRRVKLTDAVSYIEDMANDFGIFNRHPVSPEEILNISGGKKGADLYAKKINAFSNVYIGNYAGALGDLEEVSSTYNRFPSQEVLKGAGEILGVLKINGSRAKSALETWERSNVGRLL